MSEYVGVRAREILELFPRCIPCACYEDLGKRHLAPKYNVRFTYNNELLKIRGHKIRTVRVVCDCCGAGGLYHVEKLNVYENDVKW